MSDKNDTDVSLKEIEKVELPFQVDEEGRRIVTDEDVKKYEAMVNKYLREYVVKNWNEASTRKDLASISLGNTGLTMADIRQELMTEVVVGLQKFDPTYLSPPRYKTEIQEVLNAKGKKVKKKIPILDENGEKILVDKGGRPVKESTFMFTHLFNRTGQLMKKFTRKSNGYGVWSSRIEEVLRELDIE